MLSVSFQLCILLTAWFSTSMLPLFDGHCSRTARFESVFFSKYACHLASSTRPRTMRQDSSLADLSFSYLRMSLSLLLVFSAS